MEMHWAMKFEMILLSALIILIWSALMLALALVPPLVHSLLLALVVADWLWVPEKTVQAPSC